MTEKHKRALERVLRERAAEREANGEPRADAYANAYADISDHLHAITTNERERLERSVAAGSLFRIQPEPGPATDAFAEAMREQEDANPEDLAAMSDARTTADAAFRRMVSEDW